MRVHRVQEPIQQQSVTSAQTSTAPNTEAKPTEVPQIVEPAGGGEQLRDNTKDTVETAEVGKGRVLRFGSYNVRIGEYGVEADSGPRPVEAEDVPKDKQTLWFMIENGRARESSDAEATEQKESERLLIMITRPSAVQAPEAEETKPEDTAPVAEETAPGGETGS